MRERYNIRRMVVEEEKTFDDCYGISGIYRGELQWEKDKWTKSGE